MMQIPFTAEQFSEVFRSYNIAVFPFQAVLYLVGLTAVYHGTKKKTWPIEIGTFILAFLWFWMGLVYHINFFSTINKPAFVFGGLFILQGTLFLFAIHKLSFRFSADIYGLTGSLLIFFALVAYPSIGYLLDHKYPSAPTFGLPCPTTIFTFGMLLWCDKKCPLSILIIPSLWAIVGFTAALNLGFYEDIGLLFAAIVSVSMIYIKNKKIVAKSLIHG
jgi:hypothetical protein